MQILSGIILLAVLIVFHELGHFLVAKLMGVRVLVFSVGFGPKIWGFKYGETEYQISAIPLGGYVRMFGESLEENYTDAEKKISFMHQPIWRKSLIAVAGPVFNFILPVILIFFMLWGSESVFAPRVGSLVQGGVAERAGLLVEDEIIAINKQPVTSFNEVAAAIAKHANSDVNLEVRRKTADGDSAIHHIVVRPESAPSRNPLAKNENEGRIGIMPAIAMPIAWVDESSIFFAQGLRSFDEIKAIDEQPIDSWADVSLAIATMKPSVPMLIKRGQEHITIMAPPVVSKAAPKMLSTIEDGLAPSDTQKIADIVASTKVIVESELQHIHDAHGITSVNQTINSLEKESLADRLGLHMNDKIIAIDGQPVITSSQLQQVLMQEPISPHVLGVITKDGRPILASFKLPAHILDQMNLNIDLMSLLGLKTTDNFKTGEMITRTVYPLEAFTRAVKQTIDIGVMTIKSLGLLITGEVPASQIGGPIMLFDMAQQAAQKGFGYYLSIMCLLSVNLGLLNLLPIPALDGGHLLLFGIEAVQRKPLTIRTRTIATQAGIALLLLLMAVAVFNDITRLFR